MPPRLAGTSGERDALGHGVEFLCGGGVLWEGELAGSRTMGCSELIHERHRPNMSSAGGFTRGGAEDGG
jgi:hypothetical protein